MAKLPPKRTNIGALEEIVVVDRVAKGFNVAVLTICRKNILSAGARRHLEECRAESIRSNSIVYQSDPYSNTPTREYCFIAYTNYWFGVMRCLLDIWVGASHKRFDKGAWAELELPLALLERVAEIGLDAVAVVEDGVTKRYTIQLVKDN